MKNLKELLKTLKDEDIAENQQQTNEKNTQNDVDRHDCAPCVMNELDTVSRLTVLRPAAPLTR